MTLYEHQLLPTGKEHKEPVCTVPRAVLYSRIKLTHFLQTWASRKIGGREGHDWRIRHQSSCLIPIYVGSNTIDLVIE